MSWLKSKLQDWLEVKVQHECSHQWEIIETRTVEELFQLPPSRIGNFDIPNHDRNTYKRTKTKYIMQCEKCGDLTTRIF